MLTSRLSTGVTVTDGLLHSQNPSNMGIPLLP